MRYTPEDDARARSARARQVISGSQVRPPAAYPPAGPAPQEPPGLAREQLFYLAILAILLVLGLVLYLAFGFGVASIIFFLLALALMAGWLVF